MQDVLENTGQIVKRGIDMRDYRGILLKTGDILLDGRYTLWQIIDTPLSVQREGCARVVPWPRGGMETYSRAYHTFLIPPGMAEYLRGAAKLANRKRVYAQLIADVQAKGVNAAHLRNLKRKLDATLKARGIRK